MRGKEVKGGSATLSYFFVLKCVKRSFPTFQVNLLQLIDVWIFPPVVQFKKTTLAFFLFFKNSRYSYVATSQHINKKIISWRIKNWVIFLSYSLKNEENGERYFKLGYTWRFESCRIDFKGVAAASSSFGGYEVKIILSQNVPPVRFINSCNTLFQNVRQTNELLVRKSLCCLYCRYCIPR